MHFAYEYRLPKKDQYKGNEKVNVVLEEYEDSSLLLVPADADMLFQGVSKGFHHHDMGYFGKSASSHMTRGGPFIIRLMKLIREC